MVTEQNNLFQNDVKYINKYITKNKIEKKDVKILVVIDNIENNFVKSKINYFLGEYKVVDIFITNNKNREKIENYVKNINENEGSSVEILDKELKKKYNILLVFSNEYKSLNNKSSFILDYNNSDLDVESNTYLIYKNNKKEFKYIFDSLGMDISKYEKTKLGKLYIHASETILDK